MITELTRLQDFPALSGMTYLNTAAESIPPPCVHGGIEAYWQDKLRGMMGRDGHFATVEACREVSARMLGLQPTEVSFCSCSSEAYNLLATAMQLGMGDEVVVTDLDFPAGVTPWLRAVHGPVLHLWKAADGMLLVDHLTPLLNARTRLVQVSLVSFYNGHRLNWKLFYEMVRRLAPQAIISVDITQAFGRVLLDCEGADILISSTHKWTLGIHGGCIIGIPSDKASRLTTHAGGWYHLQNAFDSDRFVRAVTKTGAASFSVGMPNFVALYALNASLRYLEGVGIATIVSHADPLMAALESGLRELGIKPLCPWNGSGIIAFLHPRAAELHGALERENIHVMHSAGRIRIAVHGYNSQHDIQKFLLVLASLLESFNASPPQPIMTPNTGIPRRAFLRLSALAALAPAGCASLQRELSRRFVDAHVHVWTPDTHRYPLAPGFKKSDMKPSSFTPEALFSHCRPESVGRVVLIQMSYYNFDNSYMLDMMARYRGIFSGVAIVNETKADVVTEMKTLAEQGVRGFRLYTDPKKAEAWKTSIGMRKMWSQAADAGLSMCLLTGADSLSAVSRMCKAFPKTRVVIDHFARIGASGSLPPPDIDQLCRLADHANVFVKTSAFYALGAKMAPYLDLAPMIRKVHGAYGASRLMWASDCPFQVEDGHTYADSIGLIRDRLDFLTPEDRQWMLGKTAEKVFFS